MNPGLAQAVLGLPREDARQVTRMLEEISRSFGRPARIGLTAASYLYRMLPAETVELLKAPLLLAASHPGSVEVPQAPDPLRVIDSREWPTCTTADVVIVGSGAGGAMVARTLARTGRRVIVLEEGRQHTTAEFTAKPPAQRFTELYRDGGATVAIGLPPILLPVGRGVGGTTLVNSGTCYRTPDRVLRNWRDKHGVELDESYLDEVERTLRVAPAPLEVLGRNGELALAGAAALGWAAAPIRRNAPGCVGSCECVVGCPSGAKQGVHLNALPQAVSAGARIIGYAKVTRLLHEARQVTGVVARRPDGSSFEILADTVVVAAGATRTPVLLHASGLTHPGLGRGLAIHPALSIAGRFEEPVNASKGVLQSVGIEELHSEGVLIEATAGPPGVASFLPPGRGASLRAELAKMDHMAVLGAMVADGPHGRVHPSGLVSYRLARADADKLRKAMVGMGRVLFAAGAKEVHQARSLNELVALVENLPTKRMHLAAFHPTGSARMGADDQRAPVDQHGRLRGVDRVWVADASVLPTCPEVNPQVSIMAMALAIADTIAG